MKEEVRISGAIIRRLPRYYRYLGELKQQGVLRISSGELSEIMGVTASQIRQDLNHFGGFGQQGFGYKVDFLYEEIGKILGVDETNHLIIVGAGHLGTAMAVYSGGKMPGFILDAVFDVDPERIGEKIGEREVLDFNGIEDYLKEHPAALAALMVPHEEAEACALRLVNAGVKGIWNFSHADLRLPAGVAVENVHMVESLMSLTYSVKTAGKKRTKKKKKEQNAEAVTEEDPVQEKM
ncbi:MAG: redox-sensing transcriptional repressor Rex [Lachnospiraceae bacterium]|nr:redox-sensing transcriptional repressor Rex [Lachnospiraceae bacterium]